MFSDLNGQLGARLLVTIVVVALALIAFFLVARAWRNRGSSSFLRSGSGRQPRLAVLDTATVDAKRRLLLVRRDAVEHLILIGGPTDVVIESRIGETPDVTPMQATRAAVVQETAERREAVRRPVPTAEAAERPAATAGGKSERAEPPAVRETNRTRPAETREAAPRTQADIADVLDDHRARVFGPPAPHQDSVYIRAYKSDELPQAAPVASAPSAAPSASVVRFDDFLDAEIAGDLSKVTPTGPEPTAPVAKPAAPLHAVKADAPPRNNALDDEMARLLGEISPKR